MCSTDRSKTWFPPSDTVNSKHAQSGHNTFHSWLILRIHYNCDNRRRSNNRRSTGDHHATVKCTPTTAGAKKLRSKYAIFAHYFESSCVWELIMIMSGVQWHIHRLQSIVKVRAVWQLLNSFFSRMLKNEIQYKLPTKLFKSWHLTLRLVCLRRCTCKLCVSEHYLLFDALTALGFKIGIMEWIICRLLAFVRPPAQMEVFSSIITH